MNSWYVTLQEPSHVWQTHRSFLIGEIVFYFLGALTLIHAVRRGGRFPWLWLAVLGHGITTEVISYYVPDIDNFWHSQNMVMLLGQRLPLYVMVVLGLCVVLIDIPFDIMGIKLLWWSWHDTDPNIYDRHYWVPWTSLNFLFFGTRRLVDGKSTSQIDRYKASSAFIELLCTLPPALFSFGLGALQFIPVYHSLHDQLGLHTEVCVMLLAALYGLITWAADRQPSRAARKHHQNWFDEIALLLCIYYSMFVMLLVTEDPAAYKLDGLREPTGPCNETSPVHTAFGVLHKRRYLCVSDYDEGYYDWHCRPGGQPPPEGSTWYTICGTAYTNCPEYVVVVTALSLIGWLVNITILSRSGHYPYVLHKSAHLHDD